MLRVTELDSIRIIDRLVEIREENLYLLFILLFSICRSDQASCQHGNQQHHDQCCLSNAITSMVVGNATTNGASATPLSA
jgi:hypothetical protein